MSFNLQRRKCYQSRRHGRLYSDDLMFGKLQSERATAAYRISNKLTGRLLLLPDSGFRWTWTGVWDPCVQSSCQSCRSLSILWSRRSARVWSPNDSRRHKSSASTHNRRAKQMAGGPCDEQAIGEQKASSIISCKTQFLCYLPFSFSWNWFIWHGRILIVDL